MPGVNDTAATGGEPRFREPVWLREYVHDILDYYYPACIDREDGGYIAQLSDIDGSVYDDSAKLTVSTARFVHNFSVGAMLDGPEWCRDAASHGVDALLDIHRQDDGGYPWLLSNRDVADPHRTCYAHAFVLFAFSTATMADIPRAADHVAETFDLLELHFWEDEHGLCRGKLDADWNETEAYRGQNANMHVCEALIGAYEATSEDRYLERATTIADRLARELADQGDGLLWEHYTTDWEHDWEYNRNDPTHLFRPWGYQPGHLVEWTKLLLHLHEHVDADWLVPRARAFFDAAVEHGWDDQYGGLVYTFDRDGSPLAQDKYYWPHAEGVAAAARLAEATGDDAYWEWYDRIWTYAWNNLVNHDHGNWYFKLTRDNQRHDDIDPTPEVKTGYHQIGACYDVMQTLGRTSNGRSRGE